MAISDRCKQYLNHSLQHLATGEIDELDFETHDFDSEEELQLIQGLKDVLQTMTGMASENDSDEQKLTTADFQGQIEGINLSQAVIQFHPDGTIISANDNFLNAIGYSASEVTGQHHRIFVEQGYKDSVEYQTFWRDLAAGQSRVGEFKRIGKAGNEVWLQATYTPIKDPSGKVFKVVKYASDVTKQKQLNLKLETQFRAIAAGDYTSDIALASHEGEFGEALTEMTNTLRQVAESVAAVASGDFSNTIEIKSDKDILGKSINAMIVSLIDAQEKNRRESWIKDGQTRLADSIRGESNAITLVDNALATLANYLGAQVGVFYVADAEAERGSSELILSGTYAYDRRKRHDTTVVSGQGILGQAIKEKKTFILEDVPSDHISVDTGIGQSTPRNIVVVPVVYEGKVNGVFELGSFEPFSDEHLQLLKLVGNTLAIAINSAHNQERLSVTLETSQSQAEELQSQQEELSESNRQLTSQQEELRVANEELSEQSKSLTRSKQELQTSNEELAEKSVRLEQQQREVETKNHNLVIIQQDLEDKARDLALASKYKSEFLANMSHELRTPLNSLLILSKSFAKNGTGNLTQDQVEEAEVIHSGGQSLLNLINDILDLSKVEAGKLEMTLEEVDLRSFSSDLERLFAPITRDKGLGFDVCLEEGIPDSITTDGQRAQQIIKNLISNASKFTSAGSVTLKIALAAANTKFVGHAMVPESTIAISVVDTGIGIPEDKQKLIFESFQQADGSTSRQYGGTGLGLTISRELAKMLGGEIQLESQQGVGSTFTLFLPLQGAIKHADQPAPALVVATPDSSKIANSYPSVHPASSAVRTKIAKLNPAPFPDDRDNLQPSDKSILIIEDDSSFAEILAKLARKKGYKCLVAVDGQTGSNLARTLSPSAILLDLGLPDMDGVQLLDDLKYDDRTRSIPVHIISGQKRSTAVLAKGALGMLTKPVSEEQINDVFTGFQSLSQKRGGRILLVEDDTGGVTAIHALLKGRAAEITVAETGQRALALLSSSSFDCVILDLVLPDISGFDLLTKAEQDYSINLPPVVVYTGRDLSREEHDQLQAHAASIVVKGAASPDRLVSEVSLFLHTIESTVSVDTHKPLENLANRNVLLVDDDVRNSFALSKVLREVGLKVKLAENGQMALDVLASNREIELVVMDIMMPVMDGCEAIQKIREQDCFAELPIIALTANVLPEDRAKCLDVGASDYLSKPVEEEKLLSLIQVLLSDVAEISLIEHGNA